VSGAFSCFAPPDSFSTVPRTSGPVCLFYALELIFGGTEGTGSRFHIFCSRAHFGRSRWRRVPFSCFALLDSFSTVSRVSGVVFILALSDSFWSIPRASGPVFMFYASRPVLGGTEGVGSRILYFALLESFRTVPRALGSVFILCAPGPILGRYRGCRVLFLCFVLPASFSTVPRASSLVCLFCSLGLIFDGAEGVRSYFHVLRSRVPFSCFAL
jgi:hypothetical protein